MKMLLVFLILPFFSAAQTIHTKDKEIVYDGKEKMEGVPAEEIFSRIQNVLPRIVNEYHEEGRSDNSLKAEGQLVLKTPYNIIRRVVYTIKVSATEKGYEYTIDHVYFYERERGKKAITKSSEDILDGIGETGKIVGETEKILNETDMQFQKILALLKNGIEGS